MGTVLALVTTSLPCRAQEGRAVPGTAGQPYRLHVYEDLVDVPALVLNALHGSYRGLVPGNFRIRLDGGPPFHPRHARLEGDDPMSFVVLLDDAQSSSTAVLRELDVGVSQIEAGTFGAGDRLSVYAVDCQLVRSAAEVPASVSALQAGVLSALAARSLHDSGDGTGTCPKPLGLWDAIGAITVLMRGLPGRRVLLVLSSGEGPGQPAHLG